MSLILKSSKYTSLYLKEVSTPFNKKINNCFIQYNKLFRSNIQTSSYLLNQQPKEEKKSIKNDVSIKEGEDLIIGFDNPKNFIEKIIFGLKLHRIPQVVLNRQVNSIYLACEEAYELNKDFYINVCGLPDNFQTWFSVTQLHLWMAMVRIRAEPNGRDTNQVLVNRFFNGVEHKIRDYGIKSERIVVKTVKDMIEAFRGGNLSYDEGMCKSDAVLAAALWRNLFTTSQDSIKGKQISYIVRYVRQQLKRLEGVSSKYVYNGMINFTPPEAKL